MSKKKCEEVFGLNFARVVFSNKKVMVVNREKIVQLVRNSKKMAVLSFAPKNQDDFVHLKYNYAVEIPCTEVENCRKKQSHKHYKPASILDLAGE